VQIIVWETRPFQRGMDNLNGKKWKSLSNKNPFNWLKSLEFLQQDHGMAIAELL
jgi:hypothetical protein